MQHDYTTLAGIMAAADELQKAAQGVGLEFWFQMDFHFRTFSSSITKGIGPGCKYMWDGGVMVRLEDEKLAENMQEAREFLATYKENRAAELEKEVAELSETLKGKKAELRKVKKEDVK